MPTGLWTARATFVAGIVVVLSFCLTSLANAHFAGAPGSGERILFSLGGHELTVTLYPVAATPGEQKLGVITHAGQPSGRLTLRARDVLTGSTSADTTIDISGPPGNHPAAVVVDRAGRWELTVDDGRNRALLPFVVVPPVTPAWRIISNIGWAAAGAMLFAAFAVPRAVRVRRPWILIVLASAASASVAVAITVRLLAPIPVSGVDLASVQAAQQAAGIAAPGAAYIPEMAPAHANVTTRTEPATPIANHPFDLHLSFYDGGTGRVLDDLRPAHAALVHVALVSDDRSTFAHVHPARVGPGEYLIRITLPAPGGYTVYTELQRDGSGMQLISARLTVSGAQGGQEPPGKPDPSVVTARSVEPGLGQHEVNGMSFALSASRQLAAGAAITLTAEISDAAGPVRDLQPWLDMAGHLLVVGPGDAAGGVFFGHIHEFDSMAAVAASASLPADETTATIGPKLRFLLSFPKPGRYWLWLQTERGYRVNTVPFQVEVA